MEPNNTEFKVGDKVAKRSGDYYFAGTVIGVVRKLDNKSVRYVVEDDNGLVLVLNAKQLEPWTK